tara:strand:- start:438 stop:980 length:543 start_codon:yes stop_codon:yes gene_type:complete
MSLFNNIDDSHMSPYKCRRCGFNVTYHKEIYGNSIKRSCVSCRIKRNGKTWKKDKKGKAVGNTNAPTRSVGTGYNGYVALFLHHEDELFCMGPKARLPKNRRRVYEHRYVMAKHIGRPLEKWELVHHINHNKTDNRIENLELISSKIEHHGETFAHKEFVKMKNRIKELEDELAKERQEK